MKKILLLFIGLAFLNSCSNDDSTNEVDSFFPSNYRGNSGFLKKMKWILGNGTPDSYWYYTYNGNKLHKKLCVRPDNLTTNFEVVYEYQNDLIINISFPNQVNEVLTYDNQNRLIKRISPYIHEEYEYLNNGIRWKILKLDSNNNYNLIGDNLLNVDTYSQIVNINNYSSNNPVAVYEYDDKISPMRNIIGFNKLLQNYSQDDAIYNNITKQIDSNTPSKTINVVYEYNSDNKPIKASYSNSSEGTYLIVYLEYYK